MNIRAQVLACLLDHDVEIFKTLLWPPGWMAYLLDHSGLWCGYDTAWLSSGSIQWSRYFTGLSSASQPSRTNQATLLGTVTAIYDVDCCLGLLLAYSVGERLGRRNTILLGTIVMTIGAILQASSYSLGQMMAGRVVAGIGNGLNTSTAPI
ncbi:hypothetical protein N7504_005665 [Penicillium tannophilum]|nr:hypothetical protein N7504_005665 [Penicillium tannophilum]